MAELDYGLGAESRSFFYIYICACTGGGLVLDGIRHRGAMGLSGEIGWLPVVDEQGPGRGKVQPLGEVFSLSFLYDYLGQHGLVVTKPQDLMNLDARGRNLVSAWLKRMSKFIAEAVTHIGLVVDPDAVVVGAAARPDGRRASALRQRTPRRGRSNLPSIIGPRRGRGGFGRGGDVDRRQTDAQFSRPGPKDTASPARDRADRLELTQL